MIRACTWHLMRFDKPPTTSAWHGGDGATHMDANTAPSRRASSTLSARAPNNDSHDYTTHHAMHSRASCDTAPSRSHPGGLSESHTSTTAAVTDVDSTVRTEVRYRSLPASMLPKPLPADFTPFPLPRYDAQLGFGPTRMRDIPDVALARQRMQQQQQQQRAGDEFMTRTRRTEAHNKDDNDDDYDDSAAAMRLHALLSLPTAAATGRPVSVAAMDRPEETGGDVVSGESADAQLRECDAASSPQSSAAAADASSSLSDMHTADEEADMSGYRVSSMAHVSVMDRLECTRSVEDLLQQFVQRPQREARTATVLDLASILPRITDDELGRVLNDLGSIFTPDGRGLNFLVTRVVKYGRSYTVTSELTKAYVHFVHCLTETLVKEQPHRLAHSPALCVHLLHFLALIKVFVPNSWFTHNPNNPSNRGDYTHARGVNKCTALQGTGEELYDYVQFLLTQEACEEAAMDSAAASQPSSPVGDDTNHRDDNSSSSSNMNSDSCASVSNGGAADGRLQRAALEAMRVHSSSHSVSASASSAPPLTLCMRCRPAELVDLLAGVAGVMADVPTHTAGHCHPSGAGGIPGPILSVLLRRFVSYYHAHSAGELRTAADVALLERLYLVLQLAGVPHDALLLPLLADSAGSARTWRASLTPPGQSLCAETSRSAHSHATETATPSVSIAPTPTVAGSLPPGRAVPTSLPRWRRIGARWCNRVRCSCCTRVSRHRLRWRRTACGARCARRGASFS